MRWSHVGGAECIRLGGLAAGNDVRVRVPPTHMVGQLPPMAGQLVVEGEDLCFVPRFPFIAGTTYSVVVDGETVGELVRPRNDAASLPEVVAIHPTVAEVPRNLLRIYVTFSAPMLQGSGAELVHLVDGACDPMDDALLPMEPEFWDESRHRLTVLLDPARIKRGLAGHVALGYPLRTGGTFRIVVDGSERTYAVGDEERRRVEPADWPLHEPPAGTREPLEVGFDRPLDHALLERCLRVDVDGIGLAGPDDRSWSFTPTDPWPPGAHAITVDPVLEDLAGNSVARVFDRDLEAPADAPRTPGPVRLTFTAR